MIKEQNTFQSVKPEPLSRIFVGLNFRYWHLFLLLCYIINCFFLKVLSQTLRNLKHIHTGTDQSYAPPFPLCASVTVKHTYTWSTGVPVCPRALTAVAYRYHTGVFKICFFRTDEDVSVCVFIPSTQQNVLIEPDINNLLLLTRLIKIIYLSVY